MHGYLLAVSLLASKASQSPAVQALQVTSNCVSASSKPQVTVWDNVVPQNVISKLHEEASKSGLGHKAFTRPISHSKDSEVTTRPLIELVLDKILSEIEVDSQQQSTKKSTQFVEYWTRQEWRHIEAHADVDENLAKEQDKDLALSSSSEIPFRFPKNGHVLYLKVGSEVKGPTCLFPNKSSGGDLLDPKNDDEDMDLVIVPAVEGRLLRFDGTFLHAVPRPADLWFLSFVQGAPQYTPEETWGRSVILFNTWYDDPPKKVPLDEKSTLVDNVDIKTAKINNISNWDEVFSYDATVTNQEEVCHDHNPKSSKPAKIWLLGNERRRNYKLRTIKLNASENIRELLAEKHTVSRIKLSRQ